MSKYTTEVRFILETASGLDESKGSEDIDDIIENSWTSVFYPPDSEKYKGKVIGNVAYHTYICKLILKHYYFREIGAETAGLWKTWMRRKLQEISPYYAKLWETDDVLSATKALMDTDLKMMHSGESEEESQGEKNGTGSTSGTLSGTDTNTRTLNTNRAENGRTTNNNTRRYSDTPQGGLNGMQAVESNMYLTEAEINNGDGTDNRTTADTGTIGDSGTTGRQTSESSTSTETSTNSGNRSETFEETIQGLSGKSYSDMLMKYRETLINIDEMIIGEFEDLFLGLW